MYQALETVADKRDDKGKRYSIGIWLTVVVLAKLCGENTPYGMAEWSQVVFGKTSLPFTLQLAQNLLTWTRHHWGIENKLHYRRDVTLGEDATRMRRTHQAQVVATLNNFVIALTTKLGFSNLASARRFFQAKFDALIFSK